MIKAILFDLDETLLDRDASIQVFLEQQYARFREQLTAAPFDQYRNRFLQYDAHGYAAKEQVYARLVDEFALPIAADTLVADFYTNSWRPPILFPGATTLLQQLRAAGFRLGIITNGSARTQLPKIEQSELLSLVDVALVSEVEGVRKPDALIFQRAAQRIGVELQACVMVGDNPQADIGGALAVGMKAIWRRGYLPWPDELALQPHLIIETISDLTEIAWQDL